MKILAVCGSGVATCMIMKNKLEEIIKVLGLEIEEFNSCGLEEAKETLSNYDVVVCSEKLSKELDGAKKLVALKNMLDDLELETKLKEIL